MKDRKEKSEHEAQISAAAEGDQAAVWQLLQRCDLPRDGLADHWATALVARQGSEVVGSAALELYGESALLRSLAVAASCRGSGVGRRLAEAALDLAAQQGVTDVYLLTETAPGFFARLGFQPIGREQVAAPVRRSAEFRGACPESAQAMHLQLAG